VVPTWVRGCATLSSAGWWRTLRGKPLRDEGGALVEPEEVECVGVKTMSEEVALLCARLEASEVREGEFTSCVAW